LWVYCNATQSGPTQAVFNKVNKIITISAANAKLGPGGPSHWFS